MRPIADHTLNSMLVRVLLDLLDGALADAARGRVDDAQQADGILRAGDQDFRYASASFTSAR
jgi:hypothetical protein